MKNSSISKWVIFSSVGTVAFSMLMLELLLARMYIFFLGNVSAFIAVPITMLGLSIGALVLHLRPQFARESFIRPISRFFFLFLIVGFFGFFYLFNHYLGISSWFEQNPIVDAWRTISLTLIFIPVFATGGMLLSIAFRIGSRNIAKLYTIDLASSAAGCIVAVVSLHYLGLPVTISFLIICAGLLQVVIAGKYRLFYGVMVLIFGSLLLYSGTNQIIFTEKFDHSVLAGPYDHGGNAKELHHRWDEISRVGLFRYGKKDNYRYRIHHDNGVSTVNIKPYIPGYARKKSSLALPFFMDKKPESALVLFAGAGRDMIGLYELSDAQMNITGVEISRLVPWMVTTGEFDIFNLKQFYQLDKIDFRVDEGRAFLGRSEEKYDLIFIGSNGATVSTRFGYTRRYLDTYEALGEMLDHLESGGVLFFYFTFFHQERLEAFKKLFAERNYAPFKDSVIRLGFKSVPHLRDSYLIKPSGFSEAEVSRVKNFFKTKSRREVWYAPGDSHSNVKEIIETPYNEAIELSTDNRPYPKQIDFGKFSLFPDTDTFKDPIYGPENSAEWVQVFTMIFFTAISIVVVICFYLCGSVKQRLPIGLFSYFVITGICYMLVQISLISKLELFLGQPMYSLLIVLTSFLAFNSFGAAFVNWWKQNKSSRIYPIIPGGLAIIITPICFYLTEQLVYFIGLGIIAKSMLSILCLSPIAFILGMFYPLGVGMTLRRGLDELVPMTFGLATLSSVIGGVFALVFVINLGFWNIILIAVSGYLILTLVMVRFYDA